MGNRLEPEVMIPLERFHRFLLGFEKRSNDQFTIFNFLSLGLPPKLAIQLTIKIIRVNQLTLFEKFGFELGVFSKKTE
jgi:hypothetical protein